MSFLKNCAQVSLVVFGLFLSLYFWASAAPAATVDAFCTNPAKSICSQKKIKDDLGTTFVGEDMTPVRSAIEKQSTAGVPDWWKQELTKLSYADLKRYRVLLGMDTWFQATCLLPKSDKCLSAMATTLTAYSRKSLSAATSEQTSKMSPDQMVAFIKSASFERLYSLYEDPLFDRIHHVVETKFNRLSKREGSEKASVTIFNSLRARILAKITALPISEPDKSKMKARLSTVTFGGQKECGIGVPREYEVNAFYNPDANSVHVCNGILLKTNSPTALAMVIAHEIAHSVDPCTYYLFDGLTAVRDANRLRGIRRPYGGLADCLIERAASGPPKGWGGSQTKSQLRRIRSGQRNFR